MPEIAKLSASLTLDTSQFASGLTSAKNSLSQFGNEANKGKGAAGGLTSSFAVMAGTIKANLVMALVSLAAELPKVGNEMADLASDVSESTSKIKTLFGSNAKEVEKWSQSTAKSIGLSQRAALEAAGNYGNLFRAMNFGQRDSANLSTQLVKLAADFASFNNTSLEQALDAIRSGLVGESEPLRAFGVMLSDAALRQEALKMGLVKTTKEALEPQTKALATMSLITKQTTAAQGDFAKTSDGLANQQRILAASTEDLKTKMGEALVPMKLLVVQGLNTLIERIGKVDWKPLVEGAKEGFTQLGGLVSNVLGTVFSPFQGLFDLGKKWGAALFAGLDEWVRTSAPDWIKKIVQGGKNVAGAIFGTPAAKAAADEPAMRRLLNSVSAEKPLSSFSKEDRELLRKYGGRVIRENIRLGTMDDALKKWERGANKALYSFNPWEVANGVADMYTNRFQVGRAFVERREIATPESVERAFGNLIHTAKGERQFGDTSRLTKNLPGTNLAATVAGMAGTGNYNQKPGGDGESARAKAEREWAAHLKRLAEMQADFLDKHKKATLGEYSYEVYLISKQAAMWTKMGFDTVKIREWQEAEVEKLAKAQQEKDREFIRKSMEIRLKDHEYKRYLAKAEYEQAVRDGHDKVEAHRRMVQAITAIDAEQMGKGLQSWGAGFAKSYGQMAEAWSVNRRLDRENEAAAYNAPTQQGGIAGLVVPSILQNGVPIPDEVKAARERRQARRFPTSFGVSGNKKAEEMRAYWRAMAESLKGEKERLSMAFTDALLGGQGGLRRFWDGLLETGRQYVVKIVWDQVLSPGLSSLFGNLTKSLQTSLAGLQQNAYTLLNMAYSIFALSQAGGKGRQWGGLLGGLIGGAVGLASGIGGAALIPWLTGGVSLGSAAASGNFGEFLTVGLTTGLSLADKGKFGPPKKTKSRAANTGNGVTINYNGDIHQAADLERINSQIATRWDRSLRWA